MQQKQSVAISGMGGIGKTELAMQYAWKHWALQTYPGGVVWLKAREDIAGKIVLFARSLPMPQPPDDFELTAKVAFYWRNWQQAQTLVIVDDVQAYGAIKPLLPVDPHFKILLTTRWTLQSPVQDFEIKVLLEEKAIELLRAIVSDERLDQDLAIAKQICNWLSYLPLGIELVGRYLARRRDTSLAVLWQRLQDKRLDAKALKDATPEMTAPLGVAAAFELSWQELDEPAQGLAALLSLFALAEIPWALVEACFVEEYIETIEDLRDDSLLNLHLLEHTGESMYQLHQLLREFFAAKREQMAEQGEMKQTVCQVMVAVAAQMPAEPTRSQIEQLAAVIPHLKETTTTLQLWLTDDDLIKPSTRIAQFYNGQAAYGEALFWYQLCREIAEAQLDTDHPAVTISLNNLAELYLTQECYGEVEPLRLRCLEIEKQTLREDHPQFAVSLNNLAELYRAQGRYEEAEPLYFRALAISEQQLGADHSAVAIWLNNLANLYSNQKRYEEAEPLYLRALAISEQQLGADHSAVATRLSNLAHLYHAQGRYGEAEPPYLRALAISEQQHGADHPAVATKLNNLAALYHAQGRYGEAEPLYLRALKILSMKLGDNHSNTRIGGHNFLAFLKQVIAIGQTAQLSDHPATQEVLRQMREGRGE